MDFVCPDPKATVRAANVRATLDAFKLVPSMGRRLVERHELNIADLRPDNFILVQRWLDALREIQKEVGAHKVRDVGRAIVENADFPPHYVDAETTLLEVDTIYKLNHRGNVGRYAVSRLPDGSIEMRCETPYPRMFELGLVEGITRNGKYTHPGKFDIDYVEGPPTGDLTCTIRVRRVIG